MNAKVGYNERSWAIDLIGHIQKTVAAQNRAIKGAGGEQTIHADEGNLFPDVLLFGDRSLALILQGWELKMPDTRIDDPDFRGNAARKAQALGLDSFLLWNVTHAQLYARQGEGGRYTCIRVWDDLAHIQSRDEVLANRELWQGLASRIIDDLNGLFDGGNLKGRRFVETYNSGAITDLIMENASSVQATLQEASRQDAQLRDEVALWWARHQSEYGGGDDPYQALARANLSNWIGKFLFGHILQARDDRAQRINQFDEATRPDEALAVFEALSQDCNFWTIFSSSIGLSVMPERAWQQILQFGKLLAGLRFGEIEQSQLSGIMEATVAVAVRKLRGQYATPPALARLLVKLCIHNINEDRLLDPCCGSGTIPRMALEQKLQEGVQPDQAALAVFAGDQDPQAVQLATFALAKPDLMGKPLRVYREDAFGLAPEKRIPVSDPATGETLHERLGQFEVIAGNLPFVAQEAANKGYSDAIRKVNESLAASGGRALPGRADLAAYLPFALHPLLASGGRLGIIITNAWLSTAWGEIFFEQLNRHYKLRTVITSGAGRWFQNSDVVTNLLVMEKQEDPGETDGDIDFVVLAQRIDDMADESLAVAQIRQAKPDKGAMTIRSVSQSRLREYRALGLGGNAQFVDCDWVLDLPLAPVGQFFTVNRGLRRGWDEMFFPAPGHGIEGEYIQPVVKSSAEIARYVASAQSEAFCCSKSLEELRRLGHQGAIDWIQRFENGRNTAGKPLPESLALPGHHWYEMRASSMAELAMPLNLGDRLFVCRLAPPAFVNQRLIRFMAKQDADKELCHALLNSAVSMFIIEGMGFGRGLGVLDLSADRVAQFMHVLDPRRLEAEQARSVKAAFAPLLERDLLRLADELAQEDRRQFDQVIITAFDLDLPLEQVYASLTRLVEIRYAVLDRP